MKPVVLAIDHVRRQMLRPVGIEVERVWGRASGEAGAADGVVVPPGRERVRWSSGFEILQPADPKQRRGVLVEVENRGRPLCLTLFQGARLVKEPPDRPSIEDLGSGFLFRQGLAYARIQWQFGFADLPEDGQGAAFAILREFGETLRTGGLLDQPAFRRAYLAGYSQGGRFVRTFLREGFNCQVDGSGPVYDGALCLAGGAGYLPLNRVAAEHALTRNADNPHAADVPPYTWDQILTRPACDPKVVEAFTQTEYYNRRGSLVTENPATLPSGVRHYDLSGTTHILLANSGLARLGIASEDLLWAPAEQGGLAVNDGRPVPLNYLDSGPYLRACVRALQSWVEDGVEPPPSAIHPLRPADSTDLANPLPGVNLKIPLADDLGNPVGGVRVPDVEVPLGGFVPVWFPGARANTRMTGGFSPLAPDELRRRYPTRDDFLAAYQVAVDRLVAQRYLLPDDRQTVISRAAEQYARLVSGVVA